MGHFDHGKSRRSAGTIIFGGQRIPVAPGTPLTLEYDYTSVQAGKRAVSGNVAGFDGEGGRLVVIVINKIKHDGAVAQSCDTKVRIDLEDPQKDQTYLTNIRIGSVS